MKTLGVFLSFFYFFFNGFDPLTHGRMAVLQHHIEPGGCQMGKIAPGKFLEAGDQGRAVAFPDSLPVCPVFAAAAVGVGGQAHQGQGQIQADTHQNIGKAEIHIFKAKGGMKTYEIDGQPCYHTQHQVGEEAENALLQGVLIQAVTQLMGKDGADLVGGHGIDQIVKQDDGLGFAEAGEIGIGLGGAAGGIHDLNGPHTIAVSSQQLHEPVFQLALFQRHKLIADAAQEGVQEGADQRDAQHHTGKQQDHVTAHG